MARKPRLTFPKRGKVYGWNLAVPGQRPTDSGSTWETLPEAREGFQQFMDAAEPFHQPISRYDGKRIKR